VWREPHRSIPHNFEKRDICLSILGTSVESQKRAKEELYGKESELFVGVQVTDGSLAGARRTHSVSNQSRPSCDEQRAVFVAAAVSGARRSGLSAYASF
jgi:hypothetical protein